MRWSEKMSEIDCPNPECDYKLVISAPVLKECKNVNHLVCSVVDHTVWCEACDWKSIIPIHATITNDRINQAWEKRVI